MRIVEGILTKGTLLMNKILISFILTLATVINVHAAEESNEVQSQDWVWSLSPIDGYYYAGTTNSAGNFRGLYCYTKENNCLYATYLGSTCKKDDSHNAIVNSGAEATSVTLTCGSENALVIAPFETMTPQFATHQRLASHYPSSMVALPSRVSASRAPQPLSPA